MSGAPYTDPEREALQGAAAWGARLASRPLPEVERQELRAWLERSPLNAAALDAVLLSSKRAAEGLADAPVPKRSAQRAHGWRPALAGAAAVAVAAAFWFGSAQDAVFETPRGERSTVLLSDGSRISLDGGTRVAVHIDPLSRRVELARGRAKFEVAKRWPRAFTVHADRLSVRALGTKFVVNAPAAESALLIEGSVAVNDAATRRQVILTPGQQAVLTPAGPQVRNADLDTELAWMTGRLVFHDMPLAAAIAAFTRETGVTVDFADPRIGELTVSGSFAGRDVVAFLTAASDLHGLRLRQTRPTEFELSRP